MNGSHAVILRNNKLLLIKRRDYPLWVLPGGGIEKDESPEKAVIREVHEESGFKVVVDKRLRTYLTRQGNKHYLFKCKIVAGKAKASPESKEVKFFALDCLPQPRDPRIIVYLESLKKCR